MFGEVSEWSNEMVLKTIVRVFVPWVRIPPSPDYNMNLIMKEISPAFPTNQQIIDQKLDLENAIYVFARVNPAAFVTYRQDIIIGEWTPIADTGGRRYFAKLPLKYDYEYWNLLIEDLHCLLTAYFLTDFEPRELIDFKTLTSKKNEDFWISTFSVFGQSDFVEFPYSQDIADEVSLILSPRMRGFSIFNSPVKDIQFSKDYPWNELKGNYDFITKHKKYLRPLMLIRESFMNLNQALSTNTYPKENELIVGIVLLVSALEKLMLGKVDSEISLKFRLVGATLYENNFPNNYKLLNGKQKLSFKEGKELFKILYNIRSDLAHGTLDTVNKKTNKNWKDLAKIFQVDLPDNLILSERMRIYSMIMDLLQSHIAVFVKYSLKDFFKDPEEILDKLQVRE